jgi:hypothetical protein
MKRLFIILLLVLNRGAAFGTTRVPTDYVQVTQTNAAELGIWLSCGQTNDSVTVVMPYTRGEFSFDGARLELRNTVQHFEVPISVIHPEATLEGNKTNDVFLIGFWMDRKTLRDSSLKIRFQTRPPATKAVEYVLRLKDFLKTDEAPPEK